MPFNKFLGFTPLNIDATPTVLHVAPAYYPAVIYGGPTFSTMSLCDGLASSRKVKVSVLTTDSNGPKVTDRVEVEQNPLTFDAGYEVYYCSRIALGSVSWEFMRRLPRAVKEADLIHLTSTYNFTTIPTLLLARLMRKPTVWTPRGSLQATKQWPDAPNRWFKQLFERICHWVRPKGTVLHVTAPIEAELSVDNLPGIATTIIPNPIDLPEMPPTREWRPDGALRLMFISRLHPKKGLELMLKVLAKLNSHITLDIYGSGDGHYEKQIRDLIDKLGLSQRVQLHGHVGGEEKSLAFKKADIMCLPTHSENFGIVVGEALAHGVPVITTTEAPWQGLETYGCGRWIERSEEELLDAIQFMESQDLEEMGQRGRAWMKEDFSLDGTTHNLLDTYAQLLSQDPHSQTQPS